MAKQKSAHAYELELRKMICDRNGECGAWLIPQIRATAANMVMLDKVQKELLAVDTLVTIVPGSTGQYKSEVNPLLPYQVKLLAELRLQFETLGLNYRTTPSKITESTKSGPDESDPMAEFYRNKQV